jgi:hypothetical protein
MLAPAAALVNIGPHMNFDLSLGPQLKLDYSAKDHKGFDHVIPTVVRGGRAVPFTIGVLL